MEKLEKFKMSVFYKQISDTSLQGLCDMMINTIDELSIDDESDDAIQNKIEPAVLDIISKYSCCGGYPSFVDIFNSDDMRMVLNGCTIDGSIRKLLTRGMYMILANDEILGYSDTSQINKTFSNYALCVGSFIDWMYVYCIKNNKTNDEFITRLNAASYIDETNPDIMPNMITHDIHIMNAKIHDMLRKIEIQLASTNEVTDVYDDILELVSISAYVWRSILGYAYVGDKFIIETSMLNMYMYKAVIYHAAVYVWNNIKEHLQS